ncbi:hypothetical protein pb186bvf_016557 [Paramecium bursaria]
MKFIAKTLLIVLIAHQVIAVEIDPLKIANDRYNDLQKQHSGKFLMDLAQLHSYLSGPLDDLKETINKFYENISDGIKQLDSDYSQKTAIHEKTLQNIELNIQNAQIDIAQSQDLVDNSLISNKDITERKLKQIKINIEENRKNVERDRLQRQQQSDQNIDHIHEHSLATNSIDEALQLTAGLMNGQISFSEAPMKKTINFIKNRIDEKDEYAPIIEALVSIAGSQDAKAIRDLLNKLRKSIVDSQIQLTSNENDAQKMYEDRQKQLDSEFREFQTQVNQATYDVASISARIDQEKQFIEARKNDLSMYLDQQNMENSAFADITGLYNEFRSQKLKEAKILEDAKNFAYSAQFRELLQSKINSQ